MRVDLPDTNVFNVVGGRPFFDALVTRFYELVAVDEVLRPLYPDDLTESIHHTAGFLAQFWGGGTAEYSDERGHPRLRMRHAPFAIGQVERDHWLAHMSQAVRESTAPPDVQARMLEYFEMASTHMINRE
ncbi:MAG TPA: globin [Acidimicrobiales bacterium]|jgi:hemoglobin|nr:globin [Acidimicrobiales bacterium]HRA34369.1 globin [Acidimicrobiales bacterium]